MNPHLDPSETMYDLVELLESMEIHHERRDGDHIGPRHMRQLFRLISQTLADILVNLEELRHDEPK